MQSHLCLVAGVLCEYQRAKDKIPLSVSDEMTVEICLPLITHVLTRTAKRVDNRQ